MRGDITWRCHRSTPHQHLSGGQGGNEGNFMRATRALGPHDPLDFEISELRAIGIVLARLEALRAVKCGAATVEPYKYCVPLEDLGKRRGWADVLSRHLQSGGLALLGGRGKAAQRSSYLFNSAQNSFDINLPPEPYGLC